MWAFVNTQKKVLTEVTLWMRTSVTERQIYWGKNETVLDMMRHIPYIRRDDEDEFEPWQILERATAVDCAGDA